MNWSDPKVGLIKEEYSLLQKFYEDFDSRIMTIKGWSATIGIAAIGAGFYQTHMLWLFSILAGLVFWSLETMWKTFQYNYAPRIAEIEEAFRRDDISDITPLQVYSKWFDAHHKNMRYRWRIAFMPIVCFPHIVPVAAGILLFLLKSHIPLPKAN
jgi:hypothetical protein